MTLEVTYHCNICDEAYTTNQVSTKPPEGWGAVRPTLRVNMPSWAKANTKVKKKQWEELFTIKDKLKKELAIKEYHLCAKCLLLSQEKILRLESKKRRI